MNIIKRLLTKEVVVLNGTANVKELLKTVYKWSGEDSDDRYLVFRKAYEIQPLEWEKGISGCSYRVCERRFDDLSFLKGEVLQQYSEHFELRKHTDGTKFLFLYTDIPTFDSGDREWDSIHHIVVYTDKAGTHLISCRHGYKVPRIHVYLGLVRFNRALSEWTKHLQEDGN